MSRQSLVEAQFQNFLLLIGDVFGKPSQSKANKVRSKFDGAAEKVLGRARVASYVDVGQQMFDCFDRSVVDRGALASLVMNDPQCEAIASYLQQKKVVDEDFKQLKKAKTWGDGPLSMLAMMRSLIIMYYLYATSVLDPKTTLKSVQNEFDSFIANFVEQTKAFLNQGGGLGRAFGNMAYRDSRRSQHMRASATPERKEKHNRVKESVFAEFDKQAQYERLKIDARWLAFEGPRCYQFLPEMFLLKELPASVDGGDNGSAEDRNQTFIDLLRTQVDGAAYFFPKEDLPSIVSQGRMKVEADVLQTARASLFGINTLLTASRKLAQAVFNQFPYRRDPEAQNTLALLIDLYEHVNHVLHIMMDDLFNSAYFESWVDRINRKAKGRIDPNHLVSFRYEERGFGYYPLNLELAFVKQMCRLKNGCVAYTRLRFIAAMLQYQSDFIAGVRAQFPELRYGYKSIDTVDHSARSLLDSLAYVHANGEGNTLFKPMASAMRRVKNDSLTEIMNARRAKYDKVFSEISNQLAQANTILFNQIESDRSRKAAKELAEKLNTLCAGLTFLCIQYDSKAPSVRIELRSNLLYRVDHLDALRTQLGELLTNADIRIDYAQTQDASASSESQEHSEAAPAQGADRAVTTPVVQQQQRVQYTFHVQAESAQALFSSVGSSRSRTNKWNRFQYRMRLLNECQPKEMVNTLLDVADGLFTHRYSDAFSFKTRSGDRFVSWLMQSENRAHLSALMKGAGEVLGHARSSGGQFIAPLLERERFEERLGDIQAVFHSSRLNERRSYARNQTALYKIIAVMIQARYFFNLFSDSAVKPSERQLLKQRREFFSPKAPLREALAEVVPDP